MQNAPIYILGGRSIVSRYLMTRLAETKRGAHVISRSSQIDLPPNFVSHAIDVTKTADWRVDKGAIVISLLPIWILEQNPHPFLGAKHIIALSSTSRFSKTNSGDPKERELAKTLALAEENLISWCARNGVSYTILRPTMIYDGKDDQCICRIINIIKKYGILPLGAPALGLRQPIHADDVARAIMGSLDNPECQRHSFNIAGGEIMTYRKMIERVFYKMNRPTRIVRIAPNILSFLFRIGTFIGLIKENNFGFYIFHRMNEDLIFDCADGLMAMKYEPRSFMEDVKL